MWVQPNVCLAAHFLSSLLGLQHTLFFKNKTEEQQQPGSSFFFGSSRGVFLESRKQRLAGFILEQKIGIAGAVFLEHKTEAAWLDLYSRFG